VNLINNNKIKDCTTISSVTKMIILDRKKNVYVKNEGFPETKNYTEKSDPFHEEENTSHSEKC
jgi:hypothetical protein